MKYRKVGPVPCSFDVLAVPSGKVVASDGPHQPKGTRAINAKWEIVDRYPKQIPKNGNSTCFVKVDNHTGTRKVAIRDLTGLNGDEFQKLMRLIS
jgi:hypothetical protein